MFTYTMDTLCTSEQGIISRYAEIPPAALLEMMDDPEVLSGYARGRLALVLKRMADKTMSDPETTVSQFAAVAETLRKVAMPPQKQDASNGSGFSINISIPAMPAPTKQVNGTVIEHE
jgi:hypothetical protein